MGPTPHHRVIIAGAGISGIAAVVNLKRKLGCTDVAVYDRGTQLGGTWAVNVYPGATCDIPVALYSFEFEPAKEFDTQWPGSEDLLKYYRRVVDKFGVADRFTFKTIVEEARFSRATGTWTVRLRDVATDQVRVETCNVFVSAVGALSTPADPPFDTSNFDGVVMHTAEWDRSVSLKDKDVVVLGNGCSAAQLVPAIVDEVKSITQIARSAHAIVPPNQIPDNWLTNGLVRWIPGLFPLFRWAIFNVCESYFWMNDKDGGAKGRADVKKASDAYIERTAPKEHWDQLKYDFEFGQKRRIIDFPGYTKTLNDPKVTLVMPDTIAQAVGKTVTTERGVKVDADVIALSTGFKVTDYLFPLRIYNDEGESLVDRFKANGVKTYLTSMVATYPNLFILMGPNSVTGHSSVLFNSECTVEMMVKLLRPVFEKLAQPAIEAATSSATVEVTQAAEDEWYSRMRTEMATKIWEANGGISWYVDAAHGKCTCSFPPSRLASVLVLLHLAPDDGRLTATLTTRSKKLRSHPGETALPGGRWEDGDRGYEGTALREANEEVALPLSAPLVHLTTLAAYTSRTLLIVVPCVYLLALPPTEAQQWLDDRLVGNASEVEGIFRADLEKLLKLDEGVAASSPSGRGRGVVSSDPSDPSTMPRQTRSTTTALPASTPPRSGGYTYSYTDYHWTLEPPTPYRLHSFASIDFTSPITGLTADILIDTALIAQFGAVDDGTTRSRLDPGRSVARTEDKDEGFNDEPRLGFDKVAPGQASWPEIVSRALAMDRTSSRRTGDGERIETVVERGLGAKVR
ncbi:hypothetical protein JCM10212_000276 [Sporobolomyces blumeae]